MEADLMLQHPHISETQFLCLSICALNDLLGAFAPFVSCFSLVLVNVLPCWTVHFLCA